MRLPLAIVLVSTLGFFTACAGTTDADANTSSSSSGSAASSTGVVTSHQASSSVGTASSTGTTASSTAAPASSAAGASSAGTASSAAATTCLPEGDITVTNSGFTAYVVNGANNPTLTLCKGNMYNFIITATGHPFYIKTAAVTGTASAYDSGVTGNGTQNGTLMFMVPADAPATLHYICQFHSGMTGTINIIN